MMFWGVPAVREPKRDWLPFEYFTADVMRNPVLEPISRLFKLQVVHLSTTDERKIQRRIIPQSNFYETVSRLKLFIQEADRYGDIFSSYCMQSFHYVLTPPSDSLHVLGLVNDFCLRKNHDYFFGESQQLQVKCGIAVFTQTVIRHIGEAALWLKQLIESGQISPTRSY
jgi:hypothetical protein